jgi:hypothetical protein
MLEEINSKLQENTGLSILFADSKQRKYGIATIGKKRFVVDAKPEITQGNQSIILQQLKDASREENLPMLLFTKYIPSAIAKQYVKEGINYIDAAGNCHIHQGTLYLIIEGKRVERLPKANQPRVFREAGIRLSYWLLTDPENTNKSFRELAELAQISLGSVSVLFQELEELKFILRTKNRKVLKNKLEHLQRWVIAYNDVLRPRLHIKRINFVKQSEYSNWVNLSLNAIPEKTLWGGECAGFLLTGNLTPAKFTIYTADTWQNIGKTLKLVPDDSGKIEILNLFCKTENDDAVSPLLAYADLMGSGDSRNITTAEIILNHDLQHLK